MGNSGGLLGGKVALVTGAGEGIGKAIALAFAAHGAAVLVAEIRPETAARTAEEIAAGGGRALAVATDVREASAVDRAVAAAVEGSSSSEMCIVSSSWTS